MEVWKHNMEEEIMKISHLVEKYKIIAFDTEFPGTVKLFQKFSEDDVILIKFYIIFRMIIKW